MDLRIYNKTIRVKYRKIPLSLYQLNSEDQIRKWMRTYFPHADFSLHNRLRDEARARELAIRHEWAKTGEKEFERITEGKVRKSEHTMASVFTNKFSDKLKEKLNSLLEEESLYAAIRHAHDLMLPKELRMVDDRLPPWMQNN